MVRTDDRAPTTLLVHQSYTAEYGTDLGIPSVRSTTVAFSVGPMKRHLGRIRQLPGTAVPLYGVERGMVKKRRGSLAAILRPTCCFPPDRGSDQARWEAGFSGVNRRRVGGAESSTLYKEIYILHLFSLGVAHP